MGFFNFWAAITLRTSAIVIDVSGMLAIGPAVSMTGATMGAGTGVGVLETVPVETASVGGSGSSSYW